MHCCADSWKGWYYGLQKENIKNFVNDIIINWFSDIYITWWEPFQYPYIKEFLEYLGTKKINVSLATNAVLLDEENIEILQKVINKSVLVSIDWYNWDTHNKIRWNKNAREKTVNNIYKLTKKWIKVKISSIIWKENIDYLEKMITNWIEWWVSEIYFVWPISVWRLQNNRDLINDREKYKTTFDKLDILKEKYSDKIKVTFKRKWLSEKYQWCLWAKNLFHINSKLEVSPCSWINKIIHRDLFVTKWSVENWMSKCIENLKWFREFIVERESGNNVWCPAVTFVETWKMHWKDPLLNN